MVTRERRVIMHSLMFLKKSQFTRNNNFFSFSFILFFLQRIKEQNYSLLKLIRNNHSFPSLLFYSRTFLFYLFLLFLELSLSLSDSTCEYREACLPFYEKDNCLKRSNLYNTFQGFYFYPSFQLVIIYVYINFFQFRTKQ